MSDRVDVELGSCYEVGPVVSGGEWTGLAWVARRTPFAEWLFWGPVGRRVRRGRLASWLRAVEARGYVLFRRARRYPARDAVPSLWRALLGLRARADVETSPVCDGGAAQAVVDP